MKEIELMFHGKFKQILFDDEDWDLIQQYSLRIDSMGYVQGYKKFGRQPYGNGRRKQKFIMMHRLILGLTPKNNVDVDHINHNPCDNRKCNLRICSHSENAMNKRSHIKPGYKGVYLDKRCNRYSAQIKINGSNRLIGRFSTKDEAAIAYNEAAIKYFGEFAHLN